MNWKLKRFHDEDEGAVTVDWVVLTASIIGLSLAVIATFGEATLDSSTGVGARLSGIEVMTH
jgi:Flp pilus assembly pilin Flp